MKKIKVFTAFSGYDSQCLALDRLKKSYPNFDYELVGWSEIDKYAIQAHNALFPQWADRNYGDISEINWDSVPDFDVFTYSSPCFIAGTLVQTLKGYKPIEDIRVGDSGDVSLYKPDKPLDYSFDRDYTDLVVWVKLANWLDKSTHRMVTTEFQGNISVEECYPYPQKIDGKYHKVWARVSDPSISCNRWIAEEYITKIEELSDENKD